MEIAGIEACPGARGSGEGGGRAALEDSALSLRGFKTKQSDDRASPRSWRAPRRVEDPAGRGRVLRNDRLILFYEFFNHRAEIPVLLKACDDPVFEYPRHQTIMPETSNFIALPYDCARSVTSTMAALGNPIPSRCG